MTNDEKDPVVEVFELRFAHRSQTLSLGTLVVNPSIMWTMKLSVAAFALLAGFAAAFAPSPPAFSRSAVDTVS